MKFLFVLIVICSGTVSLAAQVKPISETEYKRLFDNAVNVTNDDFPFVFTVTTEFIENGKTVRMVTERDERQAQLRERITRTTTTGGVTTIQYEIRAGFSKNFCSTDGKTWTTSLYICFGPVSFYGPEEPISVERTINEELVDGSPRKILREFTVFLPSKTKGKRRFVEELSTIDSRGFFISVIDSEGTLDPKLVTLVRKQFWTKEKFDTISPPELVSACSANELLDFSILKWKSDGSVRIEDAYKWIYQATRGGEHAVPDIESARKWLDAEWQTMSKPTNDEEVWEPLCPGGEIVRLNLRPFKERNGKFDDLLEAFLTSSREYRTEQSSFAAAWLELGKRLKKRRIGKLDYKSWTKLDAVMKAKNYPAIHHSETYEKANHPAYRILTSAEMKKLFAVHK